MLFSAPATSGGGTPPFSGFMGKFGLLHAAAEQGGALNWIVIAAGLLTSLLTLMAIIRVWARAFWRRAADAEIPNEMLVNESRELVELVQASGNQGPLLGDKLAKKMEAKHLPWGMRYSTGGLVLAGVALTVFAGPLFAFCQRVAVELVAREPYITAVLPPG